MRFASLISLLSTWILLIFSIVPASASQSVYIAEDYQVLPHRYNNIAKWLNGLEQVDSIPRTGGSYWLAKRVDINRPDHWMVSVEGSVVEDIDFYLYSNANQIQHINSGFLFPYRYLFSYARNIDTPTLGEYWLLARVSSPYFTAQPQLVFAKQSELIPHYHWRSVLIALCLGGLIVLALYNGSLALIHQDSMFAYFAMFVLLFGANQTLSFVLSPSLQPLQMLMHTAIPIFFVLFCRQFLKLESLAPRLYKISTTVLWVTVLLAPLNYLVIAWSSVLAQSKSLSCVLLALAAAAYTWRKQRSVSCVLVFTTLLWLLAYGQRFITLGNGQAFTIWGAEAQILFVGLINALALSLLISYRFKLLKQHSEEVSQQLQQERDAARREPLTGLYNRFAFNEHCDNFCFPSKQANTLGLVDIDYLKQVNDKLGHQEGDKLIKLVADALMLTMKGRAEIFRIGGDEFAICSAELGPEQMNQQLSIADRIIQLNGSNGSGISYGCATNQGCDNLEQLVYLADMAMYQSKKQRKASNIIPLNQQDAEQQNKIDLSQVR